MVSTERIGHIRREKIGKIVRQIKDNCRPTSIDLSDSLGVVRQEAILLLSSADAWIYRVKVDSLLEQLRTGELEGVRPIATLDGGKKNNSTS